jgi:AcrR family transcriptional regulator
MIAKKAGISKGLMYNYFESKEELLLEIIRVAIEKIHVYFDPNHDNVLTKEEFLFFIRKTFDSMRENLAFWKLYILMASQPVVLNSVTPRLDSVMDNFTKLTMELFRAYDLEDAEGEYLLYTAMMKGASLFYITMPENYPVDVIEEKIISYYDKKLRK